jgi:hypothetical protein
LAQFKGRFGKLSGKSLDFEIGVFALQHVPEGDQQYLAVRLGVSDIDAAG